MAELMKSPGVHFPPPLLFVAGLAAGWWLHSEQPLPVFDEDNGLRWLLGWFVVLQGLVLGVYGLATLFFNRTGIYPNQPASTLVQSGPYRFSRNPMYAALALTYTGLSLMMNMAWPLALLPVVLFVLYAVVIRHEERYLQQAFGTAYTEYCRRVRRWF